MAQRKSEMNINLIDTFNGNKISSHRTLESAVKKQRRHIAAVKKANGENSYLTYAFRFADGTPVDAEEIVATKMALDQA